MKYIRTKGGIYEVGELVETRSAILDKLHIKYYLKQNIIAQADTIEELCDEFVVAFEENNDKITYLDLDWAIDKAKRYAGHTTIYGAVWCEWGLKYVAKMNNKGELVLI